MNEYFGGQNYYDLYDGNPVNLKRIRWHTTWTTGHRAAAVDRH